MNWLNMLLMKIFRYIFYLFGGIIAIIFIILVVTYLYYAIAINENISNLEQSIKQNITSSCSALEMNTNTKDPTSYPEKLNELMDIFENNYSRGLATQVATIDAPLRKSINRHVVESVSNLEIKRVYSLEKRRQIYFGVVYLGQNKACSIHGFREASAFYYNKMLNDLSSQQLLLLVGMVRGPSYYTPYRHPKRTAKRMTAMLKTLCHDKKFDDMNCAFEGIGSLKLVTRN